MDAREIKTVEDARAVVEARGLKHVKVGVTDIDGVIRGKYMAANKFVSALEGGFNFCDVVFGWDSGDQLYDRSSVTGWEAGFPDAPVAIDPTTARDVPLEGDMLLFLGDFTGKMEAVCPRSLLRRTIARAADMGFAASAAAEFEFFVFDETPQSVREKNYKNLTHFTPGWFGYSMLRSSVEADFYHALLKLSGDMDIPLEGLHTETGPGVPEAAIE